MTEQRIRRLRTKIQKSRTRLMSSHPFFSLLLMYLKFVAVPDMKKISTNGRCIYFSPDFLDKLYWHELDYILCHQVMHIICGNIWRPFDYKGDDYHYACDILINRLLQKQGFSETKYAHLGNVTSSIRGTDRDVAELTPEEIFSLLPYSLYILDERARSRFLPDSDVYWDQVETIQNGVLILNIPELEGMLREKEINGGTGAGSDSDGNGDGNEEPSDSGELKQIWQGRAAATAKSLKDSDSKSAGDTPDFIKRMIDKLQEPKVDWKKILNNFIQERTCDYSFSPPDRRYEDTGFFLPDFNEKEFVSRDILFMVDTSGSVDDDSLAVVYSEIKGAIEQFSGKLSGKLGFFDAGVKEPLPFSSVNDLLRIIPYGGGGTDFRPIFDYVRNHYYDELPACIVIFTDGFGPYPQENETLGIPVLWLLNNFEITPPFGKVTRIIPEN